MYSREKSEDDTILLVFNGFSSRTDWQKPQNRRTAEPQNRRTAEPQNR
jgi:hypothetical protein